MYLISFEDHGKETKNLATAESLTAAKWFVADQLEVDASDLEFEYPGDGRTLYVNGDSQYVIEPLKHIS